MTQRDRAGGRSPGSRSRRPSAAVRPRAEGSAPPRLDAGARRDRLKAVIEPVVGAVGFDLEDVSVSRAGRRYVVRVIVDADGGVGLDAVAQVSRSISAALDEAESVSGAELITGEYQLEVSSPGVDRPLRLPRHWRRNVGRLVRVTVAQRSVTGRIVAADDESVRLDVDGTVRRWGYDEVGAGRVQVEFNRLDEIDDDDLTEFDSPEADDGPDHDDEVEDEER
ncbi:ribosome maturation factor RimP [Solwaraspora sp. WMMD406]|uniref:ribosome maturation factor RimP n=1 Tax=Solwaraspora sp. WMMD406 TaxID=3016095 RepID=UPI002416F07E|nr:ribosome maturation factor RimP [Solwaraspora sp. WMMD406]MDG4767130.1 ribosome maturation factor RimP [Solwaraspora sp. WMMD406]